MKFGRFEIITVNFGTFRLDGGSMFGSVPKNIWAARIPVDDENCIPLATRSLLIRDEKRLFLTDVGMGEKWSDKQKRIYALNNAPVESLGFSAADISDVILTHLHFDHAGGISRYKSVGSNELELCYPKARIHLQKSNLENAQQPSLKERASYLKENYVPLKNADLSLVDGSVEIHPGIWVHRIDGHTRGQQWIEIRDGARAIVYPTDLIPTFRHLPVPFHMGYDACAEKVLVEKENFLSQALAKKSIVVFEHDPDTIACTIKMDDKGHFAPDERMSF